LIPGYVGAVKPVPEPVAVPAAEPVPEPAEKPKEATPVVKGGDDGFSFW